MTRALVIGGGANIWTDADAALDLCECDAVLACNDVGAVWPGPLAAWISCHPNHFPRWTAERERNGFQKAETWTYDTWRLKHANTPLDADHVTPYRFEGQVNSGSSGLFAVKVALVDLGFDQVVCAGVPMEEAHAHFFDAKSWAGADHLRRGWTQALPHIVDRVRSMSGWTKQLLGAPDEAWLARP